MKAYRVKLMGTTDYYIVTERQKQALDKSIEGKGTVVHIGGDTIRTSAIKAISQVNVDLDSCPDYFIEAAKKEGAGQRPTDSAEYRKLPTKWVILDMDGKILADDTSMIATKRVSNAILGTGKNFRQANCHYRIGNTGEREYITNLTMIPEAIDMKPTAEAPDYCSVVNRWVYGQKQW